MGEGGNLAFSNTQYSHEESLEIALLLWEESHVHYIHKKQQSQKKIPSNKLSYGTSCVATFQLINPGTEMGNLSGTSGTKTKHAGTAASKGEKWRRGRKQAVVWENHRAPIWKWLWELLQGGIGAPAWTLPATYNHPPAKALTMERPPSPQAILTSSRLNLCHCKRSATVYLKNPLPQLFLVFTPNMENSLLHLFCRNFHMWRQERIVLHFWL